ncbi:hypothetical protein [Namhaeicola litoreus]|uniref:PepSY-associated TM region n=1 Tax=Namhaeicola litoreus TaxID=1052145 RepID=A0ABW3Y180_9FLAO
MKKSNLNRNMRVYHRYLGFFLAGIMAVYAISGTILIFRKTDFLKVEKTVEKTLEQNLNSEELGKMLRIKEFKITAQTGDVLSFEGGSYNISTGLVTYTEKDLPFVLKKMTDLHKATTDRPLFFLNIFFGLSLLFFVISSFWMFVPKASVFKKGIYFSLAGLILALLILFI